MTSRGGGVDDAAFADDGGGWRRRKMMVVVAMAPGLCWDNELGGRSLVSAILLPAIELACARYIVVTPSTHFNVPAYPVTLWASFTHA